MSGKIDRALHGPSWSEVIFGAVLSAALGVALGALALVFRPVVVVKEMPKEEERARGAVYFVEGSHSGSKAKQAAAKRQAFAGGQSISLTEDELNALVTAAAPAPKAAEAAPAGWLTLGTPNFRVRDGVMQVGVPVTINALDVKVMAQARGRVIKRGDSHVFEPEETHIGSCPLHRLPLLAARVKEEIFTLQAMPEDVRASWAKLASVTIEGGSVKLTLP